MWPDFTALQWAVAMLAALVVGVAKSGFAGLGLVPVVMFATLFDARASTGITLPVLIVGDVMAAVAYRQHANWASLRRMLPAAALGVVLGAWTMRALRDAPFGPILGSITLLLAGLHLIRTSRPQWFDAVPHSRGVAWATGLLAGAMTMLTNAAGPVLVWYTLAMGLPKLALVGTIGWFFLIINLYKVPFSAALGLLDGTNLLCALALAPAVGLGLLIGRTAVLRIPQEIFNHVLLAGAAIASLRLIGAF